MSNIELKNDPNLKIMLKKNTFPLEKLQKDDLPSHRSLRSSSNLNLLSTIQKSTEQQNSLVHNNQNEKAKKLIRCHSLRQFFVHKLKHDSQKYKDYQRELQHYFNEPKCYFDFQINGSDVVVGKSLPNIKIKNIIPINSTKEEKKFRHNKKYNRTAQNLSQSRSIKSATNSSHQKKKENFVQLRPDQQYVTDKDIVAIFNKCQSIKTKNMLNPLRNRIIRNKSDSSLAYDAHQLFNMQEIILKKQSKENKICNQIMKRILKKTNKNNYQVLMNSTEAFRIKKELYKEFEEDIKKNKPLSYLMWLKNLRNNGENRNNKTQDFVFVGRNKEVIAENNTSNINDMSNINNSVVNPDNNKPINLKETIRSPRLGKIIHNSNEIKILKKYLSNDFLKSQLSSKTLNNTKADFFINSKLYDLSVRGKDLLKIEFENIKQLKGKKILTKKKDNLGEDYMPKMYKSNIEKYNRNFLFKNTVKI